MHFRSLLALSLLGSACTSETPATDECPDAPCDWQFEESEPGATPGDVPDVGVDVDTNDDLPDVDAADPQPDWQPPAPRPFPESEVVVELVWERTDDADVTTFPDHYADLDLYYCDSQLDMFDQAVRAQGCTAYDHPQITLSYSADDLIPVTMAQESSLIDRPEYVVHDMLPSGRTQIVVHHADPRHDLRAHVRVYVDGDVAWERSVELNQNHSDTFWYVAYIDWSGALAPPEFHDGFLCDMGSRERCSEGGEFYPRDVPLRFMLR